jgi:Sigma-54 interaction domain
LGNPSKAFAGATPVAMPFGHDSSRPEDWRHARAEYLSLLLMGMPRVNMLLIGDGIAWSVLGTLLMDLHEPIAVWCAGQPFVLPPAGQAGTLILHDVGALTQADQLHLLNWLELAAGRTQIISTASAPLLPSVRTGRFLEMLYYRLNTVCVDLTA